jgi:hypothetical protein
MMTETDWTAGQDPDALLDAAKAMKRLPARKARLFAGGCFRLVWDMIQADDIRLAVEMSDARADKKISQQELEHHRYPMTRPSDNVWTWLAVAIQSLATPSLNPSYVAWQVRTSTENDIYRHARRGIPCRAQAELVREVVGNPFHPVAFDRRWRTEDTVGLARGIYEDRAFDRLPLLVDALMDAGCDNDDILAHCRSVGPHVRGCWVIDLVLGKE